MSSNHIVCLFALCFLLSCYFLPTEVSDDTTLLGLDSEEVEEGGGGEKRRGVSLSMVDLFNQHAESILGFKGFPLFEGEEEGGKDNQPEVKAEPEVENPVKVVEFFTGHFPKDTPKFLKVFTWENHFVQKILDNAREIFSQNPNSPESTDNQFLPEVFFHSSILRHPFRVRSIEEADLIIVPYYGRLSKGHPKERREISQSCLNLLKNDVYVGTANDSASVKKHLMINSNTRDWFIIYPPEIYEFTRKKHFLVGTFESPKGDRRGGSYKYKKNIDFTIPYYIHAKHIKKAYEVLPSFEDLKLNSETKKPVFLEMTCSLTHKYRKYFARVLENSKELKTKKMNIFIFDPKNPEHQALPRSSVYDSQRRMQVAQFCLVPRGMTASSRRLFEAILNICIPVILSDYFWVPWREFLDESTFSIRWKEENVTSLPKFLNELSPESIQGYQKRLFEVRSRFLYAQEGWDGPEAHPDAVDSMLELVGRREGKLQGKMEGEGGRQEWDWKQYDWEGKGGGEGE